MEFFIFTLLNITLTLLILSVYDGITLRRSIGNNISSDVKEYTRKEENVDESDNVISSYEAERIARERMFDQRIALLKQELSGGNATYQPKGYIADELDPNVHNLPHESVTSLINPDIDEVSF